MVVEVPSLVLVIASVTCIDITVAVSVLLIVLSISYNNPRSQDRLRRSGTKTEGTKNKKNCKRGEKKDVFLMEPAALIFLN